MKDLEGAMNCIVPDYHSLVALSPDVIFTLDEEGLFSYVNPASVDHWGYEPEELLGRSCTGYLSGYDAARIAKAGMRLQYGGTLKNFEVHVLCRDGSMRPAICSGRWNAADRSYYCVARDGMEKSLIRKKAAESEERLVNAFKLARVAWWERTLPGEAVQASDALYEMYGISRDDYPVFTREVYLSLVHPDDLEMVLQNSPPAIAEDTWQYCHRLIRPDGQVVYLNHLVQLKRDEHGNILQVQGTTTDVTELKQHAEDLKRAEKKYHDLLESLGDGFFVMDERWTITYWNRKAEIITGISKDAIIGRNFFDEYPVARKLKFFSEFQKAFHTQLPVHFVEYSPRYEAWMDVSAYPGSEGLAVYVKDVTPAMREQEEKKKLNEKLNAANTRLMMVLESMSDGFYTLNKDWIITFATDRIADMLGIDKHDYLGKNLWDEFPEMKDSKFYTEYHRAVGENTLVSFEEYNSRFNMWFEISAYPDQAGLSVYVKDITERKRQELALKKSNERFEYAARATSDAIWEHDLQTGEVYINPSFTRVFGFPIPADSLAKRALWLDNIHPDDKDRVLEKIVAALKDTSADMIHHHYRFFNSKGETAYVTDRAFILRNQHGEAVRMIGAIKDITEKKTNDTKLEFLSRATSELIWQRKVHEDKVEINGEQFHHLFGYPEEKIISRSFWLQKVHPEDRQAFEKKQQNAILDGAASYTHDYRFLKADGSWAYVKERALLVNEGGVVRSLVGAVEDVTRERVAERALYQSSENYKQLFNSSPLPAIILDVDSYQVLDVNEKAEEHYGFSKDEFLKMTVLDLRPEKEHGSVKKNLRLLKEKQFLTWFGTHVTKTGKIKVQISARLILYKEKKVILGVVNDITEKIRLEKALINAKVNHQKQVTKASIEAQEKERSIIGKELHDNVNQILTSAKLYIENSKYYPEQGGMFLDKGISLIAGSINEIRRLSKALITPTLSDVGLKATIVELVESYTQLNLFEVRCRCRIDEGRIPTGIQLTLYRILQEAFNNTVKYAEASKVTVIIVERQGKIFIRFKDNGKGFNIKTVKKGVGLDSMMNRVEAYQGQMKIEGQPGMGTVITLFLPVGDVSFNV